MYRKEKISDDTGAGLGKLKIIFISLKPLNEINRK
jgi:hypothetical protein